MLIRIPSTTDVVRVAAQVFPDDVTQQSELVTVWLPQQADESLVNYVATHKKKIQGWIVGMLTDGYLNIQMFQAETPEVLASLWKKVVQTYEIETAQLMTTDPETLKVLQFEPLYMTMEYRAKGSDQS